MAGRTTTRAPLIDELLFGDLREGEPGELRAGARVEGRHFAAADLSGQDVSGIVLSECRFDELTAHGARLRGARLSETAIERLDAPVLSAAGATLQDVAITRSRLGSAELYDAEWRGVRIASSKLGYVNLRGSQLRDVLFVDCAIDELDLGGAVIDRLAFVGCRVGELQLGRARLKDADLRGLDTQAIGGLDGLRGATLSPAQLVELAPLLAREYGIRVE